MILKKTMFPDASGNRELWFPDRELDQSEQQDCLGATIHQGYPISVFHASGLVPPSPWTDASGLSVDASGLVPPHQVWKGGDGGDSL